MSTSLPPPPENISNYVTSETPVELSGIMPGNLYRLKSKSGVDLNEAFKGIAVNQYHDYLKTMVDTEYDETLGFTEFNIETLITKLNDGLYVYYIEHTKKTRANLPSIPKRKFNYYNGGVLAYNSRRNDVMAYYSIPDAFFEILDIYPVTLPVSKGLFESMKDKFGFGTKQKGGKKSIKRNKIRGIKSKLRRRSSVRRKKTTRRKHN